MSHFTVAVIHKANENLDALLSPYYEQVEEGDEYAEFQVEVNAEQIPATINKLKEEYSEYAELDDKEILSRYYGVVEGENGDWGYWVNSNAKWDWYVLGGRWRGLLKLKLNKTPFLEYPPEKMIEGFDKPLLVGRADSAYIKDVDFTPEKEAIEKAKTRWENHLERLKNKKEDSNYNPYYEYGIDKNDTKESYIKKQTSFSTFAVLEDGEWQEAGQMGWFGAVNASQEDRINWEESYPEKIVRWQKEKPDYIISIIDCHI